MEYPPLESVVVDNPRAGTETVAPTSGRPLGQRTTPETLQAWALRADSPAASEHDMNSSLLLILSFLFVWFGDPSPQLQNLRQAGYPASGVGLD